MKIENNIIKFESSDLGDIKDAIVENNILFINGFGFSFENYPELEKKWLEIYPNGKPVVVVNPVKVITEEEKYRDMVDQLMASYLASFPPIV